MKKFLLASLAIAALFTAPARAADMSTPVYKAPPVVPQFGWAGPYIGAHLGYDWGRTRVIDNGVLAESGAPTNGVIGGLLIGMNWQSGLFVYGVEADFGLSHLRGTGNVVVVPPPVAPPNGYSVDWNASFRGRFGYVIFPSTLLFATGGLGISDFSFFHGGTGNSFGSTFVGWTAGGGIDHAFTNNLIGRIEYLYADYGNKTYEVQPGDFYNAAFKSQTLRGALIWKF